MALVSWNINGYRTHHPELRILIRKFSPLIIICVQETKLRPIHSLILKDYTVHRKDVEDGIHAHGGVAILIHKTIFSKAISLNTELQAICVQITLADYTFCICNIYFPPAERITTVDLNNLFQQVPSPSILTGDFNAHNPLWGSTTLNTQGELVEEVVIHTRNFNLLNTGVATHMCMASGTTSCIDLTFCSRSMLHRLERTVVDNPHGSNHFPILVYLQSSSSTETRPSFWVFRQANWEVFTNSIQLPENYTGDVESMATLLENEIIRAAKESIPRNKGKVGQSPVPWWNEEINEVIRSRKRALNKLKQHPTKDYLIQYKRLRARARYLIKESKPTNGELIYHPLPVMLQHLLFGGRFAQYEEIVLL